jgi:hypothetical protein
MYSRMILSCAILLSFFFLAACGAVRGEEEGRPWDFEQVAIQKGEIAPGPEDVAKGEDGLIWVSSTDRRSEEQLGGIYVFNARDRVPELKKVEMPNALSKGAAFRPHGIDYLRRGDQRRLFVIDHSSGAENSSKVKSCESSSRILIYEAGPGGKILRLLTTLSGKDYPEGVANPNDIAAVDSRSFYVTNLYADYSCNALKQMIFGQRGYVSYFDGERFHRIEGVGRLPNGVAVARRDGAPWRLYVSSTLDETLSVFDISKSLSAPAFVKNISIKGMLDNIHVLDDGALLVAAHPGLWRFYFDMCCGVAAGSRIVRVQPESGKVETIFDNDGDIAPAASSAVLDVDGAGVARLAVGAVFHRHPVLLKLRTPFRQGAE